jgi:bifunctional NMN adenylyltransferase/nudix hydrolase
MTTISCLSFLQFAKLGVNLSTIQKYEKVGYLVGRFQFLHPGHRELIRQAVKKVNLLIIFVGSANAGRGIKNPWTFKERKTELLRFLNHEGIKNYVIYPVNDYDYSDSQWMTDIRSIVHQYNADKVVMIGHEKEGNDYLSWFPEFEFENVVTNIDISATDCRETLFREKHYSIHENVHADWDFKEQEKQKFSVYPYPETLNFVCADSLVECLGHILLIKRKFAPGKNQWALPGGFKNASENLLDCSMRELREETNIRVAEKVLRGSIVSERIFDNPKRNVGIPRITKVFHYKIKADNDGKLPRAKGADDAVETRWATIQQALNEFEMFTDHGHIISSMTGVMPIPAHLNKAICQ